jgi:hypothetical protein
VSQTKAELIKGLNINASAPATALQIDASGNVNIDSNTLYVDATNNRVGLGTSSPTAKLESYFSSTNPSLSSNAGAGLSVNGTSTVRLNFGNYPGSPFSSWVQSSDGSGTAYPLVLNPLGGAVGIGTTGPLSPLVVSNGSNKNIEFQPGSNCALFAYDRTAGDYLNLDIASKILTFNTKTAGGESARIDSSGRLLVGTSSSASDSLLQIQGVAGSSTGQGAISLRRGYTPISDLGTGSTIGKIDFEVSNGGVGARIAAEGDAAMNTNDYPSRLVFSTTADGASSPQERCRIGSNGYFYVGTSDASPASNNTAGFVVEASNGSFQASRMGEKCADFNRGTNDGAIVNLRQDGAIEGTISVSGTTVSYNGAHLSRWSQLPGGAERTEILRGTVLSNIDEMCGWGEEDNEQLNRMKVSDVEGDPNVSGVFQSWDDDDDTYTDDFYCAMTGDMIIRIAEGVTVQRGDLLMSAGDGTAKPQDDDIIRSKTVAKVTSTHVTCTYDDGSYCVPCVLMAC